MTTLLFDTNTLSYWLKYPPAAAAKKATLKLALMKRVYERVADVDTLYFSVLTKWEIERGYVDVGADRQRANFAAVVSSIQRWSLFRSSACALRALSSTTRPPLPTGHASHSARWSTSWFAAPR